MSAPSSVDKPCGTGSLVVATGETSSRAVLALLATVGALLVTVAPATAAGLPTVPVPSVTVPSVTTPTVTVPTVTVPTSTAPPVTVGPITTPQVTLPSVATPTVGTSPLPVNTPSVTTPGLTSHASGTTSSPSSGSRDAAPPASSAPTASASAVTTGSNASPGAGHPSKPAGNSTSPRAAPTTRRAVAGHDRRSGSRATTIRTAAATAGAAARPGSRTLTATAGSQPARSTKNKSGPFGRLVNNLPSAVLFALLAFGVIAAAMTLNAYLQGRRARSLAGQRKALLSDVGVLQAALLPAVPDSLGELDVSVAYRPAQGLAAGGDFFDVFTMSPERTGIIIGDVSGHGRESLIQAALVRYTLRTLMGEGHPLPEVLARADRYLSGELGDGFATVIVCCYDHTTAELSWAKAGHEPPIIAGEPDHDEQAATPLGFGLGDRWPQFSRILSPGERVCLFTDGLTEARRQSEQLGRAHLHSLVDRGLSAQALVERIQSDADDCSDDLAAVVLARAVAVSASVEASDPRQAATV
jgi:hypothetical protein